MEQNTRMCGKTENVKTPFDVKMLLLKLLVKSFKENLFESWFMKSIVWKLECQNGIS